jgi:hypothetical protein
MNEATEVIAYDFKELAAELKTNGLEVAEESAEVIAKSVFNWFERSAVKSVTKYDDLFLAVLPLVKPIVFKQIDKIDGQEG